MNKKNKKVQKAEKVEAKKPMTLKLDGAAHENKVAPLRVAPPFQPRFGSRRSY